jgi:hypothetical protein
MVSAIEGGVHVLVKAREMIAADTGLAQTERPSVVTATARADREALLDCLPQLGTGRKQVLPSAHIPSRRYDAHACGRSRGSPSYSPSPPSRRRGRQHYENPTRSVRKLPALL